MLEKRGEFYKLSNDVDLKKHAPHCTMGHFYAWNLLNMVTAAAVFFIVCSLSKDFLRVERDNF